MTVEELLKKREDLYKQLQEKKSAIDAEKRIPTPEERAESAKVVDDIMAITNELETAELNERIANTDSLMKESRKQPARPDIKRGVDETRTFRSFGDQLKAVYRAAMGVVDPRLTYRASGMTEAVPGDGGFLVQTDFSAELLRRVYETNAVVSRVRRIPVSGNANGLKMNAIAESSRANGSRWGGILAYWLAEAGTKTASAPKFRQIELSLKKLVGLAYCSDELLEDATALEAVIREGFNEEIGFRLQDSVINGTGAGMPLGIMNSGALVSVTRNTAAHVYAEDIIAMWSRCYSPSRSNAVWFINQDVEPELHKMSLETKTPISGQLVYMPPGGLSGAPFATLLGRPVIPIECMQTMGTSGDIGLFDLSSYIMIDKGGLQSASSIHVKFTTDETAFRFVFRCDGQPWWSAPLTPFKGSNTLSPFVVLTT